MCEVLSKILLEPLFNFFIIRLFFLTMHKYLLENLIFNKK